MKPKYKTKFLILIAMLFIVGCDCVSTNAIEVPIPMSLFFEKSSIRVYKVDEAEYNSIIHYDNYTITIDRLGRGFTINNELLLNDSDYCHYRVIKDLWINGVCTFTDNISNNSIYSEYVFAGIDTNNVPLPKAKQECTTVVGFSMGTIENTFNESVGKYKIDSTNKNIWYLYYDNSWWRWDVTPLNLTWDGYERWQKYKREYLEIGTGSNNITDIQGYIF